MSITGLIIGLILTGAGILWWIADLSIDNQKNDHNSTDNK